MTNRTLPRLLLSLLLVASPLYAEDEPAPEADPKAVAVDAGEGGAGEPPAPADPGAPKTLSGMSILGNEEAPKSLVIIPWKSSEIGSDLGLNDDLGDSARPVDKEVFLRELAFYKIRSGE